MPSFFRKALSIGLSIAFIVGIAGWRHHVSNNTDIQNQVILLVPDNIEKDNQPVLSEWLRAAKEEGAIVYPLAASEFLLLPAQQIKHITGLILPDTIHRQLSDPVIKRVKDYVTDGGNLFITYDAGIETPLGYYEPSRSRVSDLVGMNFGLYGEKKAAMIEFGSIFLNDAGISDLNFPPGRFIKQDVELHGAEKWFATSYRYPTTQLPYFLTNHPSSLKTFASSNTGAVILSEHRFGKGNVFFANLPVGYLATQTDALFLHVLLKNFTWNKLHQPIFSSVPDGIGGLIMNWHVDAGFALKYLDRMQRMGFYEQGPYSIHITTGPDTNKPGDSLGVNVSQNPTFQNWMREIKQSGHSIGSHGGWAHNYFAYSLTNKPTEMHKKYLALNKYDIENTLNSVVTEYSAPNGKQPKWVTEWLVSKGFKAFYTTGNIGLGPTRITIPSFFTDKHIWAFPVSTFGQAASFEEAHNLNIDNRVMSQWLSDMTSFCINERSARLIYFHPPGLVSYEEAVTEWLSITKRYKDKNLFRWYTMSSLAEFLENREATSWTQHTQNNLMTIEIDTPTDLSHQTWLFNKVYYEKPYISKGNADIFEDHDVWRVVARKGKSLEVNTLIVRRVNEGV